MENQTDNEIEPGNLQVCIWGLVRLSICNPNLPSTYHSILTLWTCSWVINTLEGGVHTIWPAPLNPKP